MMGPTHAMFGAACWMAAAPAVLPMVGVASDPAVVFAGLGVCAGAALLPDIDTPSSTVARSFGPLSWLLAQLVDATATSWYNLTKTSREPVATGGHRKLTHTLLGMVAFAAAVAVVCGAVGRWAVLGLLFVLMGLAIRGLMGDWAAKNGWIITTAAAAGVAYAAYQFLPADSYWWMAIVVLLGLVSHGVGDAITKEGVPWLAPLRWRRKGWWEFGLPSMLRIRAGGLFEYGIILPLLSLFVLAAAAAVALGGWDALLATIESLLA